MAEVLAIILLPYAIIPVLVISSLIGIILGARYPRQVKSFSIRLLSVFLGGVIGVIAGFLLLLIIAGCIAAASNHSS